MSRFTDILSLHKDDLASNDIELRSYSGRGMGGAQCIALVASDEKTIRSALAEIIVDLISDQIEVHDDEGFDAAQFTRTALAYQTDSMGRGIVVYWSDEDYNEDDYSEGGRESDTTM